MVYAQAVTKLCDDSIPNWKGLAASTPSTLSRYPAYRVKVQRRPVGLAGAGIHRTVEATRPSPYRMACRPWSWHARKHALHGVKTEQFCTYNVEVGTTKRMSKTPKIITRLGSSS